MNVVPYKLPDEGLREWVSLMTPAAELSKVVANTDFVPKGLRGNPAAITAAILYGDEVGLGPMQALAKIAVIDGRPTLSSEAQRSLILAAGHELWVEESTLARVTVAGRRRDSDQTNRATWTMDDARRAGLAAKPNWKNYPRQMLLARASAELARAVFADAIGGLAATEEFEGEDAAGREGVGPVAETGRPTRRRTRTSVSATVSSAPLPAAEPAVVPLPGEDTPNPPTEAQTKRMHALFGEKGFRGRDDRLEFTTVVVQRPVESSVELSADEVSQVIDALEKIERPQAPDG